MKPRDIVPTKHERVLPTDRYILSTTDLAGRITSVNDLFIEYSGYPEAELIGRQHNIVRDPDMPRAVFQLLWDAVAEGEQFMGYVKNLCRDGAFYWVFAHVTPSFDNDGKVTGYHSSRRVPDRRVLRDVIEPLYGELLRTEAAHASSKEGLVASFAQLMSIVKSKAASYDELIFSL